MSILAARCRVNHQSTVVPPPVTTGLVLWLNAKTLPGADGSSVTSWPDSSPAETPTSVISTGFQLSKTYMGGYPAVSYPGGGVLQTSVDFTGWTGGTIFAVLKNTPDGDAIPNSILYGPVESDSNISWLPYLGNTLYDSNLSSARSGPATVTSPDALSSPFLYCVTSDSSGGSVELNGVTALTNSNAFSAPALPRIGYTASGSSPAQSIGAVLVYNRVLTSDEKNSMHAWFSSEWGVP